MAALGCAFECQPETLFQKPVNLSDQLEESSVVSGLRNWLSSLGKSSCTLAVVSLILAVFLPVVLAQEPLRPGCVVAILNRTALVREDGTWTLDNLPANADLIRARAVCSEGGVTQSGQSRLFAIVGERMNAIIPFSLDTAEPIPVLLTVNASPTALNTPGATSQLTVTAVYTDGMSRDVTLDPGTTYTVSNSLIAAIDTVGVVSARSSGSVVISATNEGVLGLARLQVTLSGDSDGDGIPDDAELANGLNPNDPVDALEDFDRDGLTNAQELALGTDIRTGDSDGDGLPDGQEVTLGTNPLLADTDGDGIRDGLEVQTGSNPADASSFNLAQALSSITVAPSSFVLTVNSIIGGASQQIIVTGNLRDGTTINLTSTNRGTSYSSSDLGVCSFGSPDGRVFAGSDGNCTLTASNSGFSDTATASVRSFAPLPLSYLDVPGFANRVAVSGSLAYVAAGPAGLHVLNVSDRRNPFLIVTLPLLGNANDVKIQAGFAYVAAGDAGLHIIDLSTPQNPVLLRTVDTPGTAIDLAVGSSVVYVADGSSGVQIVSTEIPSSAAIVGTLDTEGQANGVDIAGPLLAVTNNGGPVDILDVSSGSNPQRLSSVTLAGAFDVQIRQPFVYVATSSDVGVIDISDPASPRLRGTFGGQIWMLDVISGNADTLFTTQVRPDTPMPIFSLASPATPASAGSLIFSTLGAGPGDGIGLAADPQYVYMTASAGFEFDTKPGTTGATRLYIGQYLSFEDRAGVSPSVNIVSPADGAAVVEGSTIAVRADASDDVQVASVDFTVNGRLVFTDIIAPYEFSFTAPTGTASVSLGATATDLAGNQTAAAAVGLNVGPDVGTTVVGRVTDATGNPVPGAVTTTGSRSAVTDTNGFFSISGVPGVAASIVVAATATVNGTALSGVSGSFAPVVGGVTDVGTVVLLPEARTLYASVSASHDSPYTCAVTSGSQGLCWGFNSTGNLGNGTTSGSNVPSFVSGGLTFSSIDADNFTTCGVTTGGQAYCWGDNFEGALGTGSLSPSISLTPLPVTGGFAFQSTSTGAFHTCGVTTDNRALCWGCNIFGELGDGTFNSSASPNPVAGGLTFASVSAGSIHSCGLTISGQAYCWGPNYSGQLGDGTFDDRLTPAPVAGALTFSSITSGSDLSCGVTPTGQGYCWGDNSSGAFGSGTTNSSSVPVPVSGGLTFQSLSTTGFHTCGITTSGQAYCWGSNFGGRLGDGTTINRLTAVPVTGSLTFRSISAGSGHTCGVTTSDEAYCWGQNGSGQLGNGTNTNSTVPVKVAEPQ